MGNQQVRSPSTTNRFVTDDDGQGDGVPKACRQQAGRRTCEGPELACVRAPFQPLGVAHEGREGRINVLPWYRLVGVAILPTTRKGGRNRAARKGKWSPRGTGMTVLTYPCPTASRVSVTVRSCARVTGKAGENGQNSGEVGGSSPWTRPSAPRCGDTVKAPAGDQCPILGGDRLQKRDGVAVDGVTGQSHSSARRRLNVQSGLRKGR